MAIQHNAALFLNSLEAGDMISFHRYCKNISHWGIYVGNENVVHLTGRKEDLFQDIAGQNGPLFTVADKKYKKAYVNEDDFFAVAEMFLTYERNVLDNKERMKPNHPDKIVQLAKAMKGSIYYDGRWNSCKKMAIYCRYFTIDDSVESKDEDDDIWVMQDTDASTSCQSGEEIPLTEIQPKELVKPDKKQKYINDHNEKTLRMLKEGDLIRIKRLLYSHWAVYIGNENVIHLSAPRDNEQLTGAMRFINIFSISGVPFPKGIVRRDKFYDVVSNSKADIKNKDDEFTPKPVDEIITTAKRKLGETGYNLLWNNCEQFAMQCRYGRKISYQVIVAMVRIAICIAFISLLFVLNYKER